MTMFAWLLAQWDATSVGLALVATGFGGVWLSVVGCVYRYQRLVEIRTILRLTPPGGSAAALSRRGPSTADDEVLAHIFSAHSENVNFIGAIERGRRRLARCGYSGCALLPAGTESTSTRRGGRGRQDTGTWRMSKAQSSTAVPGGNRSRSSKTVD